MKLGNPYKGLIKVPLRTVIAQVGEDDWNAFTRAMPIRGNQDQLIGTLVHSFMQEFHNQHIPHYYEPDNASRIKSILRGITFQPVDRG